MRRRNFILIAAAPLSGSVRKAFAGCETIVDEAPVALLRGALSTYSNASSLSARGTIVDSMQIEGELRVFTTVYEAALWRPFAFRITWTTEYKGRTTTGAVWSRDGASWLYRGPGVRCDRIDDASLALAAATGISFGASFTLPNFFFESGSCLSSLTDLRVKDRDVVNGVSCTVVEGKRPTGERVALWMSQEPAVIHKMCAVEQRIHSDGGDVKVTDDRVVRELILRQLEDTEQNRDAIAALLTIQHTTESHSWSSVRLNERIEPTVSDFTRLCETG